jgi:two-component system, response regulator PdtaR
MEPPASERPGPPMAVANQFSGSDGTRIGSPRFVPMARSVNRATLQPEPSPDVKVLVAEDEIFVRLMLADALRDQGFQVFEAAGADDAVAILRAMQVDVVITDLHMRAPAEGMLVARYVREHCPGTSVLLAAATTRPPVDGSVFDAVFIKPYRPEDVASWINRRGTTPDRAESALP